MKIAIFHFPSLSSGGDTFIFDYASALADKCHEVDVITSNQNSIIGDGRYLSSDVVRKELGNATLHEFKFHSFIPTHESFLKIRRLLKNCDILYTKNEIIELSYLTFLLHLNIPIICGIHTSIFYPYGSSIRTKLHNFIYTGSFYSKLLHVADATHVLNHFDFNLVSSMLKINSNVYRIPLGIDTQKFKPVTMSNKNNKFNVLFVNKLDEQKGIDILIDAISVLSNKEEFCDMMFTVVGGGSNPIIIKNLPKFSNVRYLGFIPKTKLISTYNSNDILVVPSRWETLSYACIEAQSCGLPVIASDIPGPNEVIQNRRTGMLIPPESGAALANAILDLYYMNKTNNYSFNAMKEACRNNAVENYSLETSINKLEHLFLKLIEESN